MEELEKNIKIWNKKYLHISYKNFGKFEENVSVDHQANFSYANCNCHYWKSIIIYKMHLKINNKDFVNLQLIIF